MGFSDAGLGIEMKKLESAADGMSLHSADPGSTGANELSGGGYQRRGAPLHQVGTQVVLNSPQSFDCPAGAVTYVGLWQDKNSSSPDDWIGGFLLDTPHTFGDGGGIYTVTALTLTATGTP